MIHIHNGDAVAALARRSNIPGEHLAYREALIVGPVIPGDDWIETRAQALAAMNGDDLLRIRTSLLEQEQALTAAVSEEEIVLWFEHDLFCLVHLVHMLERFRDAHVTLVWCPQPLDNNDELELHLLFDSRAAVTPSMLAIAGEVWRAYTSSDPRELNRFLGRDAGEFPFLRDGLTLHASRFPSTKNGLGAIEQHALELMAGGATDFATLFDTINARVPRFGFGDSEIFRLLRGLASRAVPLITLTGEAPKAYFTITPAGENVLRGEVDDVKINDPDVWFGGAHLTKETMFRWNGSSLIAAS